MLTITKSIIYEDDEKEIPRALMTPGVKREIKQQLIEFFKNNPTATDDDVHNFAATSKINTHQLEEVVYELLGSFFGHGRSIEFNEGYDPKQLKMGIKVEMEHTNCELIAEKIAEDHLAEIDTYYSYLKEMEDKAGVEK